MNRVKVESSTIAEIGFDYENKTLEVKFNKGAVYHYFDVPDHEVFYLIFAKSIGSHFMGKIAKVYKYKQIGNEENLYQI